MNKVNMREIVESRKKGFWVEGVMGWTCLLLFSIHRSYWKKCKVTKRNRSVVFLKSDRDTVQTTKLDRFPKVEMCSKSRRAGAGTGLARTQGTVVEAGAMLLLPGPLRFCQPHAVGSRCHGAAVRQHVLQTSAQVSALLAPLNQRRDLACFLTSHAV